MNRRRVDVKSLCGERLEPLAGFNQGKWGWGIRGIFRCSKRVKQMGPSGKSEGSLGFNIRKIVTAL